MASIAGSEKTLYSIVYRIDIKAQDRLKKVASPEMANDVSPLKTLEEATRKNNKNGIRCPENQHVYFVEYKQGKEFGGGLLLEWEIDEDEVRIEVAINGKRALPIVLARKGREGKI
ncbi:hypothetical protein AJ80_05161 [Polytolypa hystricis UAMH7299]|uniref:Uncharacterized protein n=1 Tax=Polytolypa hystricis (strain UAMH7299) TaxID=1447883 RepID=A0A2B7Y795_POLH7|nr:hypothetical protein AJ80_05161 [Polytolypa hystricis UAMH7299]